MRCKTLLSIAVAPLWAGGYGVAAQIPGKLINLAKFPLG